MSIDREEIRCAIALTRVPRLNAVHRLQLVEALGSATRVMQERDNLSRLLPDLAPRLADELKLLHTYLARADEELAFAERKHIRCLCWSDPDYPARLRECPDAPLVLYYRGTADLNRPRIISIVGTRHCTEYGRDVCRRFMERLRELCPDVLIVSGLAYGVDIEAHRNALQQGMDTVGVLAHGLDQIYPRLHRQTATEMLVQGGLLTEFMSGSNADKVNFVRRNRIVAGMADAVVVVESAEKGGSLITAELAADYNRDVFAVPGRITDPYSRGCNNLLRDNRAAALQSADDLVQALRWEPVDAHSHRQEEGIQRELFPTLAPEEQLITAALHASDGKPINQLCVETNLPVHRLTALLFELEMKGVVRLAAGGMYRLLG